MYPDDLCYSSCPKRFFTNDQVRLCQPCPYDCYTCDQNGACLSCNISDNRILSVTQRCEPIDGYFDVGVQVALACPSGCLACSSLSVCSSCISNLFLIINELCYTACPPRYIENIQTFTCETCPFDCYTCDSSGLCLSCN